MISDANLCFKQTLADIVTAARETSHGLRCQPMFLLSTLMDPKMFALSLWERGRGEGKASLAP